MLQKTQNILWHGECSCLQHWNHLYSWWRITWTIVNPLRTQQISQWNRCSTYLQDWCPNNQMTSMEWKQLPGKILHGSMSLVMNKSSVFSAQRSTSFQICSVSWKEKRDPPKQTLHGNKDWSGSKLQNAGLWTELMVSQLNSSGKISQDSPRCSSATKSKSYC